MLQSWHYYLRNKSSSGKKHELDIFCAVTNQFNYLTKLTLKLTLPNCDFTEFKIGKINKHSGIKNWHRI